MIIIDINRQQDYTEGYRLILVKHIPGYELISCLLIVLKLHFLSRCNTKYNSGWEWLHVLPVINTEITMPKHTRYIYTVLAE